MQLTSTDGQTAGLNSSLVAVMPSNGTAVVCEFGNHPDPHTHSQLPSRDLRGLANQGNFEEIAEYRHSANLVDYVGSTGTLILAPRSPVSTSAKNDRPPAKVVAGTAPSRTGTLSPTPSSAGSSGRNEPPPVLEVIEEVYKKFRTSGYLPPTEQKSIADLVRCFYGLYFYPFGRRSEQRKVYGFLHKLMALSKVQSPLMVPFSDRDADELESAFTRLEKGGKYSLDLRASIILKLSTHQLDLLYRLIWKLACLDACNRNFVLVQSGKTWRRRLVTLRYVEDYKLALNGAAYPLSEVPDPDATRENAKPKEVVCHECHNSHDPAISGKSAFDTRQKAAAHVNSVHVKAKFKCGFCERSFARLNERIRHWKTESHDH